MASLQQTDLSYAWEKYMDCRLQGADLQVGASALLLLLVKILFLIFLTKTTSC